MTKDKELKESVKKPIKELVKEIVSDTAYKLVKASAKKTVIALRDRLKEEASRRLEDKLKEAVEKRIKQTAKKLEKEFTQDTPQSSEYISKIKQSFEEGFQKLLSPPSIGLLKPIIITAICALVAGGIVGWGVAHNIIEPPPPQPDLIISEVTFDIECPPTTEYMAEWPRGDISLYQVTIHYVIENQGEADAGQSISCLRLNGEVVAEDMVNPLAAGEKAERAFYEYTLSSEVIFPLFDSGNIDIELCADCGGSAEESNEENNCAAIKANLHY